MPTRRFGELAETAAERFGLVTVDDAREVGYEPKALAKLAGRGQLERVSRGVYRVPFMPGGAMQAYMAAALWPQGVQGVLTHDTALLRAGEKARVTGDVDLVLRGDPESLLAHLDASLADDYEDFSFERNEPQRLELRPHVYRTCVKVAFRSKPFMTLVVEVAPVEVGGDEIEEIAAHDLSTIGLDGPDVIPVLAVRWQIAQKLHAVTEPPLRPGGENPRYGTSSTCNSSEP